MSSPGGVSVAMIQGWVWGSLFGAQRVDQHCAAGPAIFLRKILEHPDKEAASAPFAAGCISGEGGDLEERLPGLNESEDAHAAHDLGDLERHEQTTSMRYRHT